MSIDQNKIRDALKALDPADDGHWTSQGLPMMAVMVKLVGDETLTRAMVNEAAPGFERPSSGAAELPAAPAPALAPAEEDEDEDDEEDEDEEEDALEVAKARSERQSVADAIRSELMSVRDGRARLDRDIAMAKAELDKMDQQIGALTVKLEQAEPPLTDAERLKQVAARALEERRARVHASRGSAPSGRSRLDTAMRNSGRRALGTGRPTYPGTPKPPKGKQG